MDTCFIIQPFNQNYNQLYEEVFKKAVIEAGLLPYRIDQDFRVRIPIESIEKGIKESLLCFAEISTNNPNVWYELGFAFACNKDIIMICSDKRTDEFPFDIRHRQIIKYKTDSPSDFDNLREAITAKINAYFPPASRTYLRSLEQKDWLAVTDKETPQWASYQEIIKGFPLVRISCKFKTSSSYFRFGFKITTTNGKLFGDTIIRTRDSNLLLHVFKDIGSSKLLLSVQESGIRGIPDEALFDFQENEWVDISMEISPDNILSLYVQNELCYNTRIASEVRNRLFILAWGDRHEYKILVKDIQYTIEKTI